MNGQGISRWIGLYVAIGGFIGVVMFSGMVLWMEYRGENGLTLLPLVLLQFWAAYCGLCLFQGTSYGWRWAPLVLALQIPVIMAWGVSYDWFNALAVIPYGEIDHGILSVNIRMRLGEGAQLFYGAHAGPSSIGLNLVALACLIVLLVQRRTRSRRGTKIEESKIEEKRGEGN